MPLYALPQRPWQFRIVGITERGMNFKSANSWNLGANGSRETEFRADLRLQPQDRNHYDGAVRLANGADERSARRHGVCLQGTEDSQAVCISCSLIQCTCFSTVISAFRSAWPRQGIPNGFPPPSRLGLNAPELNAPVTPLALQVRTHNMWLPPLTHSPTYGQHCTLWYSARNHCLGFGAFE